MTKEIEQQDTGDADGRVPVMFRVSKSTRTQLRYLAAVLDRKQTSLLDEALQAIFEKYAPDLPDSYAEFMRDLPPEEITTHPNDIAADNFVWGAPDAAGAIQPYLFRRIKEIAHEYGLSYRDVHNMAVRRALVQQLVEKSMDEGPVKE